MKPYGPVSNSRVKCAITILGLLLKGGIKSSKTKQMLAVVSKKSSRFSSFITCTKGEAQSLRATIQTNQNPFFPPHNIFLFIFKKNIFWLLNLSIILLLPYLQTKHFLCITCSSALPGPLRHCS